MPCYSRSVESRIFFESMSNEMRSRSDPVTKKDKGVSRAHDALERTSRSIASVCSDRRRGKTAHGSVKVRTRCFNLGLFAKNSIYRRTSGSRNTFSIRCLPRQTTVHYSSQDYKYTSLAASHRSLVVYLIHLWNFPLLLRLVISLW